MKEKKQLLHDIDIVCFVLVDLALYLDTHPKDKTALEYYNHYNRIKGQLEKEFSKKYYPLSMDLAEGNMEWKWGYDCADEKLPWDNDCCEMN